MKTIGIIAEYNPFHNGHAYQISEIRKKTGADYLIAAMSGDFVQRGTPAILDKYARTRMALSCGIDLVIELPALWAVSSAEAFAAAGVALFEKTGCIDGICFGAETGNLPLLTSVAAVLAEEPDTYRTALTAGLKTGLSFPAARAKALCTALPAFLPNRVAELSQVLDTPNNILAIEYLKAMQTRRSPFAPLLIERKGAGYHDSRPDVPNASATAIRNLLFEPVPGAEALLRQAIPEDAFPTFSAYLAQNPLLVSDDFSSILGYRLLCEEPTGFSHIADANPDISNRISKHISGFSSFTQFCAQNKSRNITYTRMSRILLHLLLQHTNADYIRGKALDYIPYLRLLGFRKASAPLLRMLKENASVPIISKLADAPDILSSDALWLLNKDIFAANLYEQRKAEKQIKKERLPHNEYAREIVLV